MLAALERQAMERDIAAQAAIANYQAQAAGAQGLAGTRMQQFGLTNPLASQAANYWAGASFEGPQDTSVSPVQTPDFTRMLNAAVQAAQKNMPVPQSQQQPIWNYQQSQAPVLTPFTPQAATAGTAGVGYTKPQAKPNVKTLSGGYSSLSQPDRYGTLQRHHSDDNWREWRG